MFFKSKDPKDLQRTKAMIRIVARRILAAYPEAALAIGVVCDAVHEADGANLLELANQAVADHTDLYDKDPMLAADVKDLMALIGIEAPRVNLGEVKELMKEVCSLVN